MSRRPSPSMVVALIALAVALSGTAYAGLTIRSGDVVNNSLRGADVRNESLTDRDIKNNTLRGGDIRNGTLRNRDFRAADLAELRGGAGPAGAAGATGPQGPTGPRGPSSAVLAKAPEFVDVESDLTTVVERTLPAGSWVLNSSGTIDNDGPQGFWHCRLEVGDAVLADTSDVEYLLGASGPTDRDAFGLTGATTIGGPATARLRCRLGSDNGVVFDAAITAIQVDSLTG